MTDTILNAIAPLLFSVAILINAITINLCLTDDADSKTGATKGNGKKEFPGHVGSEENNKPTRKENQ